MITLENWNYWIFQDDEAKQIRFYVCGEFTGHPDFPDNPQVEIEIFEKLPTVDPTVEYLELQVPLGKADLSLHPKQKVYLYGGDLS